VSRSRDRLRRERGSTLLVIILVITFMLGVGVALLSVSGTGSRLAGNMRSQEDAFNVAEAGFEAARIAIDRYFLEGSWSRLQDNCLTQPTGIDLPVESNYFRKLSDIAVIQAVTAGSTGVVFYEQPMTRPGTSMSDPNRAYTVFLIDDEAGSPATPDPSDALMVCIGVVRAGNRVLSTARIEVLIGVSSD